MNDCYFLNTSYSAHSETINSNCDICPYCSETLLLQNRYRILGYLGGGGFGKTFEVLDTQKNQLKVLKVLLLSRFAEPNRRKAALGLFEKEAKVLKRLSQMGYRGIPHVESDGYFTIKLAGCREVLHCLVMEKIDGVNLKQWMHSRNNRPIKLTRARTWLKQLVEILDQIHIQNCIHRDIKPDNIMIRDNKELVLIDFGAVKEQQETYLLQVEQREGTVIGTIGYAPPEQMAGNTKRQSDFFALARTFVYLLTGKHPIDLEYEQDTRDRFTWQDKLPINDKSWVDGLQKILRRSLVNLLDDMMEPCWEKRPKDTKEILRRINKISNPVRDVVTIASSTVVAFILIMSGIDWYTNGLNGCSRIFLRRFPQGDNISCGEEILGYQSLPDKQKGVDAFVAGNYHLALDLFTKAWEAQIKTGQKDPETLIYLNNSRLAAANIPSNTIAVVVPRKEDTDSLNVSAEILQGVAQAQDIYNQSINQDLKNNQQKKPGLKVLIASDGNNSSSAQRVATSLVQKRDVMAVIGHFNSDATIATFDIYQKNKLLFITPSATSEALSKKCQQPKSCFFRRVVPSDSATAKTLANYLINKANKKRALVFYNPDSKYSSSLQNEFSKKFAYQNRKVLDTTELNNFFNIETANRKIQKNQPDVLVLFPNTDGVTPDQAVKVITRHQSRYLIVGGDSTDSRKILEFIDEKAVGFVMAVPWHSSAIQKSNFLQIAQQNYWGDNAIWQSALSYDATRVLLAALEKLPSPQREQLPQVMAEPDFKTTGATGTISFQANGNRKEENVVLVKVVRDSQTGKLVFESLVIGH
ncbi:MAG: bifunctional serine/threonine-protein kinase/ABC transporter substrate-binding protein [Nostocaceae cyanobacterium]|nr:bifunctional serine/threonine-protein kinase/ABC transporter substrate-binding protein [Nostocaceae cyanobacterium]